MLETIPGQVIVVTVVLLISTIAYSSQYFIFIPALQDSTLSTLYVLGPFNILVIFIFYNYYLAVSTDPGKVPSQWEPPSFVLNNQNLSANTTPLRFCKTCQVYKPPRAHHCRYCHRCVLKMDHHCPWINNCVGINNYPHFLRFIFFVDVACAYVIVLLIWRTRCIMDAVRHFRFDAEPTTTEVIFLVLNFVLTTVVLFSVAILSGYHLYCLTRNQSTIEAWEREKVETLIRRRKIPPFDYPFSLGVYNNLCSVLGNNPLLWLCPTRKVATGDGLTFPVQSHIDSQTQHFWPPRDPDDLRPSIFSSKYKRQQEKRQQWKQQQELEPMMMNDDLDDSEDYYDSGSFITDSDDEYSLLDEEENTQSFGSRCASEDGKMIRQTKWDHHHNDPSHNYDSHNNAYHTTTAIHGSTSVQYRSPPPHSHTPQLLHHLDDGSDNDDPDYDDTIPLSSFLSRPSPSSSKDSKKD